MDSHARILVVGGGIFGCSTAYALGRQGYSHVEVLERDHVGSGSTALAAGILSLHTWNDLDARLILRTRSLLEELVAWGRSEGHPAAATAWHRVGGVTIAGPARRPLLEEIGARARRMGESTELLEGAAAGRRFPELRFAPDEVALVGDGDGYLESSDVMDLVRRRARHLGVRFREGVVVERLVGQDGALRGADTSNGLERADAVVVAGGAWTSALLATVGARVAALAYRTQLAALDSEAAQRLPVVHDTVQHFYARPESEARFLAGDGTQLRPFDPATFDRNADADFVEATAARLLKRLHRGQDVRFRRGWAGLCVGTPDRRPLAGAVPGMEGLFVLTGDNGFGLMRGLALGEVVAAALQERGDGFQAALAPSRFGPHPPQAFALSEGFSFPD